jgi:hypothetical protein
MEKSVDHDLLMKKIIQIIKRQFGGKRKMIKRIWLLITAMFMGICLLILTSFASNTKKYDLDKKQSPYFQTYNLSSIFYQANKEQTDEMSITPLNVAPQFSGVYIVVRNIDATFTWEYSNGSSNETNETHSAGFPGFNEQEVSFSNNTLIVT